MKVKSENFIIGNEIKTQYPAEGISRQIMGFDGQLMLVKVVFKKGAIGYAHEHYHSQSSYVVSGVFEVTIKGETRILTAGDGFYVEPDALHGAVCLEDGILIDVFSPVREDFLK